MTMSTIVKKTKYNPLILHINPIGLLRIGDNNESRFEKFNTILNNIQNAGGNIAIPTFSYSYAQNKLYDMINTPSNLDEVGEYLRKKNVKKRTIDPNFSYLLFGNNFTMDVFPLDDVPFNIIFIIYYLYILNFHIMYTLKIPYFSNSLNK